MKRKTAITKRSIFLNGQKTSVSLEIEFWEGLHAIARQRDLTASKLAEEIARHRTTDNLSSAIRIFVFNHYHPREVAQTVNNMSLLAKAPESRAFADRANDEGTRAAIPTDYETMADPRKRASESSGN